MVAWNRIDYDRLESEGRWRMRFVSQDPREGVPVWLLFYLAGALALLALLPGLG